MSSLRIALFLTYLGLNAVCLHGQMSQAKRISSINKFKSGSSNILVATDVASRGLDIPDVDLVINFDIPAHGKTYIHRVGRTARNGRSGRAVTFVTQYDIEALQQLESLLGHKLPEHPTDETKALLFLETSSNAQKQASIKTKEFFDARKLRSVKHTRDRSPEVSSRKKQRV